jgi:spermidine/putrescine transport system permease protein
MIYSEVKKGINPEMYALSTMIFVSVLLLLWLVNRIPEQEARNKQLEKK